MVKCLSPLLPDPLPAALYWFAPMPSAVRLLMVIFPSATSWALSEIAKDKLQAAMQQIVDAKATKYNCSIALGLRLEDPPISFEVAAGITDRATGRRAQPSDKYVWGSITKTFTGPAILRLVEQGVFSLDAPAAPLVDKILMRMNQACRAASSVLVV